MLVLGNDGGDDKNSSICSVSSVPVAKQLFLVRHIFWEVPTLPRSHRNWKYGETPGNDVDVPCVDDIANCGVQDMYTCASL